MAITQTVEIPANRRLTIDVPREVPVGRAVLTFAPAADQRSDVAEDATEYLLSSPANRERMKTILKEEAEGKLISFETIEQAIEAAQQ